MNIRGEDWYAEELGAARHAGVTFDDVDLTEATSSGAHLEDCLFRGCRFNSSTHTATAFVGSTFQGGNFFDATLDGCKLTGSVFEGCTLRPLKVVGGVWRGVTLRGATLTKVELTGLDLT
jgi:uncharacterized protein YjbI with pentapeptide repeats